MIQVKSRSTTPSRVINLWDLSQEATKEYKIPQKLWVQVEKILTKLSLAATSEPPAKRARVDHPPPRAKT